MARPAARARRRGAPGSPPPGTRPRLRGGRAALSRQPAPRAARRRLQRVDAVAPAGRERRLARDAAPAPAGRGPAFGPVAGGRGGAARALRARLAPPLPRLAVLTGTRTGRFADIERPRIGLLTAFGSSSGSSATFRRQHSRSRRSASPSASPVRWRPDRSGPRRRGAGGPRPPRRGKLLHRRHRRARGHHVLAVGAARRASPLRRGTIRLGGRGSGGAAWRAGRSLEEPTAIDGLPARPSRRSRRRLRGRPVAASPRGDTTSCRPRP